MRRVNGIIQIDVNLETWVTDKFDIDADFAPGTNVALLFFRSKISGQQVEDASDNRAISSIVFMPLPEDRYRSKQSLGEA